MGINTVVSTTYECDRCKAISYEWLPDWDTFYRKADTRVGYDQYVPQGLFCGVCLDEFRDWLALR